MRTFLLSILFFFLITPLLAQTQTMDIDRLQALYIYNIYKYTKLPEKDSYTIGLYGADQKLITALNGMLHGKRINGKEVAVSAISSLDTSVDVVFVAAKNSKHLIEYFKSNKPKFLVITQKSGLCEAGSMANLVEVDGKIKLELNEQNLADAGFRIASELKSVAKGS
jgi:hypothetical protein